MAKARTAPQGEIIYGINPLIEVLRAKNRRVITVYTTKPTPRSWSRLEPFLSARPARIQHAPREVLTRMAGSSEHQGVVALVQPFTYTKKLFNPSKHPFLLMLDGIQDPRNLGAILRSAYCTGVTGVVMTKKSSAPLSAAAFKASAGLAEYVPIYQAASPKAAAQELRAAGYELYLAVFDGEQPSKHSFKEPLCLVIGSEGGGISKEILSMGAHVTLPQRRADISYNASVAAGILLFTIGQRNGCI